jgi:hypothetical protein
VSARTLKTKVLTVDKLTASVIEGNYKIVQMSKKISIHLDMYMDMSTRVKTSTHATRDGCSAPAVVSVCVVVISPAMLLCELQMQQ